MGDLGIVLRMNRLRALLEEVAAGETPGLAEVRERLAEAQTLLAEDEATPIISTAHPLGANPARTALILFHLDRCETLLHESTLASAIEQQDSLLSHSLLDVITQRLCSAMLYLRGIYCRQSVGYEAIGLREVLFARLPAPLARLLTPMLPATRRTLRYESRHTMRVKIALKKAAQQEASHEMVKLKEAA